MYKKLTILIILIINAVNLFAAEAENLLQQANQLYSKGEYAQAAEIYENILKTNEIAPELYYNLGNAYFKQNEIAKSILNYERALRLAPNYADARHNLTFAQQKLIDKIPDSSSFFLARWTEIVVNLFNSNTWLYASFGAFLFMLICIFFFIFGGKQLLRKSAFYIAFFSLLFSVVMLIFAGIEKKNMLNRNSAIVMNGAVTAKSSPDQSGTDLFVLHEGTKIVVVSTLNSWVEIRLTNGNVGWVEEWTIEKI
ncbi:MAG: tetratricopeptide repeat protein [Paludibacter sp.]|nr:tetratricopeptide repeat protein [Paludibacter sp.]